MRLELQQVPTIRLFLSWYHGEEELTEDFVRRFKTRLSIERDFKFEWADDSGLALGKDWEEGISGRVAEADYVVQLLSPGFLASENIDRLELRPKGEITPSFLPVSLVYLNPADNCINWKGVNKNQIFLYRGGSYEQTPAQERNGFVDELAGKVRHRIQVDNGASLWRPL